MNTKVLAGNLLLLRDLGEALDALRDLSPLAIKGAVFSTSIYRPDERPMEDLDLLVPAENLIEARRRLEGLGFLDEAGNPTNLRRGPTVIDLESSIWYLDAAGHRGLWSRAIELDGVPTLSWEDHFVFVVAHSAAHHGWWDEQHAEDLRRLLTRPLDWELAAKRLREAGLSAASDASFRLLGLAPPIRLELSTFERLESRFYEALLRRGQLPAIGHYLRWWSSAGKLSFLYRALFPDSEFLRRRYATERPALYRALRPALLACSVVRSLALTAWVSVMGEAGSTAGGV